ncbi:MAG: hypothetical protein Q9165_008448 [Trypethelium subeluteriae]
MATKSDSRFFDVAIVGGGLGGLSLAIGLLKNPHLRVKIYESAEKFSDIGAGLDLAPNAQQALKLIDPKLEQVYSSQAIHNNGKGLENVWVEFRNAAGPNGDQAIAAPTSETGSASVHRAKFVAELAKLIPEEVAHFKKVLGRVENHDSNRVTLHFNDGTTATAHCAIGADGVHSVVRKGLLGEQSPAANAIFSGAVAYRVAPPLQEAIAALGTTCAQVNRCYVGKGRCIITYPIDHRQILNIGAVNASYDHWDGPWVKQAEYSKIAAEFSDMGQQVEKIIKLFDRPGILKRSILEQPPAPTYFHGQGAAQTIVDAFVLQAVFALVDTPAKIPMAFQAYDSIRRPRSQKVWETSREAGELITLRLPGVLDDEKAFRADMDTRMDWIWNADVAGEGREAVAIYNQLAGRESA